MDHIDGNIRLGQWPFLFDCRLISCLDLIMFATSPQPRNGGDPTCRLRLRGKTGHCQPVLDSSDDCSSAGRFQAHNEIRLTSSEANNGVAKDMLDLQPQASMIWWLVHASSEGGYKCRASDDTDTILDPKLLVGGSSFWDIHQASASRIPCQDSW